MSSSTGRHVERLWWSVLRGVLPRELYLRNRLRGLHRAYEDPRAYGYHNEQHIDEYREEYEAELAETRHEKWRRKAERWNVLLPEYRPPQQEHADKTDDGMWELVRIRGRWVLSTKGVKEIRAEIRDERKAWREEIARWVPLLSGFLAALTGLIGAAIGLLSVLGD